MQFSKRLAAVLTAIFILISCVTAVTATDTAELSEVSDTADAAVTAASEDISVTAPTEAKTPSAILGDIDSDYEVTIDDSYYLRLHYAGAITLSAAALKRADANLDGTLSLVDASYIQAWLAGVDGADYLGMDVEKAKKTKQEDIEKAKKAEQEAQEKKRRQEILDQINNFTRSKGVDISEFNGNVDMKKLKAQGYSFVIIRLGYGSNYTDQDDKLFETNVKNAEAAGLDWGAYIYSYALTTAQAKSEVNHTLRLLKGKKPTMPIAFDWEDDDYKDSHGMPSDAVVRDICRTYLSGIRDAGYYPILYTGYEWLKGAFNHTSIIDQFDIWYAQWSSTYDYKDRPLGMWQYGGDVNFIESPYISGLSGEFDKDYAYKNYPMIIKAYGYNNHTALLSGGLAATSADNYSGEDTGLVKLPDGCNGVMGDSLKNK